MKMKSKCFKIAVVMLLFKSYRFEFYDSVSFVPQGTTTATGDPNVMALIL